MSACEQRHDRIRSDVPFRTSLGLRPPDCTLYNMRAALLLALLMLLSAGIAEGAAQKSHPYRTRWKHATVGKGALGRVGAGAGVAQLRKTPPKYGGGASGFGKRLGAGFATNAVKTTVEHGVAEIGRAHV